MFHDKQRKKEQKKEEKKKEKRRQNDFKKKLAVTQCKIRQNIDITELQLFYSF